MKKYFTVLIFILALIVNLSLVFNFALAGDAASDIAKQGLQTTADEANISVSNTSPVAAIGKAINILLSVLGVIFLIVVLYGGVLWLTAGGEAENVKKARRMLIEGAIGLIISLGAYSLSEFIVRNFQSAVQ